MIGGCRSQPSSTTSSIRQPAFFTCSSRKSRRCVVQTEGAAPEGGPLPTYDPGRDELTRADRLVTGYAIPGVTNRILHLFPGRRTAVLVSVPVAGQLRFNL